MTTRYTVYDCGRTASIDAWPEFADANWRGGNHKWKTSSFPTLEEARAYATCYLGRWGPFPIVDVGIKHDYSGRGHFIWIEKHDN